MKQSIDQLCDEEIQPVEIERKESDTHWFPPFFLRAGSCTGLLYTTSPKIYEDLMEGRTKLALSRLIWVGLLYIGNDIAFDYVFGLNHNKTNQEEKK